MQRVVSISLGSSGRNHSAIAEFGGNLFRVERIGTDGDKEKAIKLIKDLDGKVDAFGLGGTDLYLYAGSRRYLLAEAAQIAAAAKKTPIVDGSGIKNTLERRVLSYLAAQHNIQIKDAKVLLVCAVDRFGLAEALVSAGCRPVFGDLLFGLGLPVPIRNIKTIAQLARVVVPIIAKMPVKWFYPTGQAQNSAQPRFSKYFTDADIIAGDFHFIRKFMPNNLKGKIVITNTVTRDDLMMLKAREVALLVTTTPEMGGRSFGTNVLEAILVALSGKRPADLTGDDYDVMLSQYNIKPRIENLVH